MAEKIKKPRGKARLKPDTCIACGARCESACPVDAVKMDGEGSPIIDEAKCIGCDKCVKVCPAEALYMFLTDEQKAQLEAWEKQKAAGGAEEELSDEDKKLKEYLAQYRGVWVFVEQTEGLAADVSWELLGEGRKLADKLGVELCAVVMGENVSHLADEAGRYGAEKVYLADMPVLKNYRTQSYHRAMCWLVEKYRPEVILMGATGMGRDLAGAVATEVATGLTADCTGLDIDDKRNLMQTRPAFGGNIMATIMCDKYRPQMATVRPRVMGMPQKADASKAVVITEQPPVAEDDILSKVLSIVSDKKADDVDISGAEILVSGGRGMMAPQNFKILQELAEELGGTVSASRSAVDAGWMAHSRQVGQTGKTVRPKIYIACGISGAIQHLVGMQDSDVIIAINKDKDAPIFEVATYGIVGDLFEIVPALTEEIRRRRAEKGGRNG
ncbi:electron transfer flavoprotein subunit alpha [Seleniivibrio woodruffii]|uniref:electron transfer flavoprotein subunit alpha n=1 Tax=Seleniivibrio woodruffii TaxID=1078050 RepID=UPI0026EE62EE|nr:electron transfer flavoprotein subunit alpha [Seleniivibrio woodruffii]